MNAANCIGWWEQNGLGRQPMEDLVIEFSTGLIRGSGRDVVGEFEMYGTMDQDGRVKIVKQYVGRHQVVYVGSYDGEGTMFGSWLIEMLTGSWSIKLLRAPA
ncbi:MAG: hypothetical protein SFV81_23930 [Pirellulaceae bacterium]|nr:hypothetical protein [Pirellulaceae bacterium]